MNILLFLSKSFAECTLGDVFICLRKKFKFRFLKSGIFEGEKLEGS
jgi:hypothetical protein